MKLLYLVIIAALQLSASDAKSLTLVVDLVANITKIEYASPSSAFVLAQNSKYGNLLYGY